MKKLLAISLSTILLLALSACTIKIEGQPHKSSGDFNSTGTQKEDSKPETANPSDSKSPSSSSTTSGATDAVTTASPLRRPIEGEETKTEITQQRAIEIAVLKAGLNTNDVYGLRAEYDKDREGNSWDVEFKHDGFEYAYEIDAVTEAILDYEKERIDYD